MTMHIKKYIPSVELEGLTYTGIPGDVEAFTAGKFEIEVVGDEHRLSKAGWNVYSVIEIGDIIMHGITGEFFIVKKASVVSNYTCF
jgi:hypothetical protein